MRPLLPVRLFSFSVDPGRKRILTLFHCDGSSRGQHKCITSNEVEPRDLLVTLEGHAHSSTKRLSVSGLTVPRVGLFCIAT